MRRAIFALTTICVFILLIQPITQVPVAKANPFGFGSLSRPKTLIVHSPTANPYLSLKPTVDVSFDYYIVNSLPQVDHFYYSLDGYVKSALTCNISNFEYNFSDEYSDYSVSMTLGGLSNGNHSATFYAAFLNGTVSDIWDLKIIIDPTYKNPVPIMISPLNQTTYDAKDVPLVYTINSTYAVSLYCLDFRTTPNRTWISLGGNGTLASLTEGPHELRLKITIETRMTGTNYVEYSEIVNFNVAYPTSTPTVTFSSSPNVPEFPATLAIAFLLMIVLAVTVMFKRK
jgi:hypothetical protein